MEAGGRRGCPLTVSPAADDRRLRRTSPRRARAAGNPPEPPFPA